MIKFNQFFSGIGKSKQDQNGFDNIVNCDVHSEVGLLKPQLALILDSATVSEASVQAVSSVGTTYFFSKSTGKIWKRSALGVYSSLTANANATGHVGAVEYNGWIYYWTASKLGRFAVETEGSRNDSFGTASNSNFTAHALVNLSLYIGDGRYVASVDEAGSFAANALDLPTGYIVTALKSEENALLVGTTVGSQIQRCRVYLWDTFSDSWTLEDEVPEAGVVSFVDCLDITLAVCGVSGKIYYWSGSRMSVFESDLRGVTTALGYQFQGTYKTRPVIVAGNKIFSLYKQYASSNYSIVQEFTSTGTTIASISILGAQMMVAHDAGVDKVGSTYATATIDTPEVPSGNMVVVEYDTYPDGIGISTKVNGGTWTAQTPIIDTVNRTVYFDGGLPDVKQLQARITLTPSGANIPKIIAITIL